VVEMSGFQLLDKVIVEDLYTRIKPVVRFVTTSEKRILDERGDLYYIEDYDDIFHTAFRWSPVATTRAMGLVRMAEITTYHTYGYYGFFKPTIAEVISQIPDEYLKDVVAFETGGDVRLTEDEEHHVATTILYKKKEEPKEYLKDPPNGRFVDCCYVCRWWEERCSFCIKHTLSEIPDHSYICDDFEKDANGNETK